MRARVWFDSMQVSGRRSFGERFSSGRRTIPGDSDNLKKKKNYNAVCKRDCARELNGSPDEFVLLLLVLSIYIHSEHI